METYGWFKDEYEKVKDSYEFKLAGMEMEFTEQIIKTGGKMEKRLLMLRSAIADKEWAIACANMETARSGSWTCDWDIAMGHAQQEIDSILKDLELTPTETEKK